MYYFLLQLNIPIDEFESKKWFRCVFVSLKLKEEVKMYIFPEIFEGPFWKFVRAKPHSKLSCKLYNSPFLFLQKEFTVYIDKNGTVEDMLQEAAREVCVSHLTDVLLFFYNNNFAQITFGEGSTQLLR